MAILKDLLVSGAARFNGDTFFNTIKAGLWHGSVIEAAYLPSATTTAKGVVKLNSATNSTSTSEAATASAVNSVYTLANGAIPKTSMTTSIGDTGSDDKVPTEKAVRDLFKSSLSVSDAMVYKGTYSGKSSSQSTVDTSKFSPAPGSSSLGWTWKVSTAGYFADVQVGVGTTIISRVANPGTSKSNYNIIPSEVDTGTLGSKLGVKTSSTNASVYLKNGAGSEISNSGITIAGDGISTTVSGSTLTLALPADIKALPDAVSGILNSLTNNTYGYVLSSELNGLISAQTSGFQLKSNLTTTLTNASNSNYPSTLLLKTELDNKISTSHVVNDITQAMIDKWDLCLTSTDLSNYPTLSDVVTSIKITTGDNLTITGGNSTAKKGNATYNLELAQAVTDKIDNGNTAYSWGNHATLNYVKTSGVTSITIKNGTGITGGSDDATNTTGTYTIGLTTAIQADIANGATAYSWGNHASAGYIKTMPSNYTKSNTVTTVVANQNVTAAIAALDSQIIYTISGDTVTFGGKDLYAKNMFADATSTTSDIRQKNVIGYKELALDAIANIPIFTYTLKNDPSTVKIGTSAQAVLPIISEVVNYNSEKDLYSLDYATLGTVIGVKACEEIQKLKNRIEYLEQLILKEHEQHNC